MYYGGRGKMTSLAGKMTTLAGEGANDLMTTCTVGAGKFFTLVWRKGEIIRISNCNSCVSFQH